MKNSQLYGGVVSIVCYLCAFMYCIVIANVCVTEIWQQFTVIGDVHFVGH